MNKPLGPAAVPLLAALAVGGTASALAQDYASKPLRMIVPYAAGAGVDFTARIITQELGKSLRQSVVVENRTGASGMIGSDFVAKAAPDGYTLAMVGTPHVIIPSLFARLPYDTVKDFAPITQVTSQPYVMAVHPSVPAKSVGEFIALARCKPGALNYGSAGPGTTPHMATELLKSLAGINLLHVPYNGGAPAISALIGGETALLFVTLPSFLPLANTGKVRPLAVSSLQRSALVPQLPTMAESGVPGFEVVNWTGVLAPSRTPNEIAVKLHAEISRLLQTREVRERLATDGSDPVGSTPEEFGAHILAEIAKWGKLVKATGMRME